MGKEVLAYNELSKHKYVADIAVHKISQNLDKLDNLIYSENHPRPKLDHQYYSSWSGDSRNDKLIPLKTDNSKTSLDMYLLDAPIDR